MTARILIIAGSDSGGGAGIQADLKTVMALDGYGMTAITALTAQNTQGVHAVEPVSPGFVADQIRVVLEDIGADAIKTGMLHRAEVIEAVADTLASHAPDTPLILDPVMVAKGGAPLLDPQAIEALKTRLFPQATLLTPNIPEAEHLLRQTIHTIEDMETAARTLHDLGPHNTLIKGGHLPDSAPLTDILLDAEGIERWHSDRIDTPHTHGTGCTLASAIACGIGQGLPLRDAITRARDYVRQAIHTAPGLGHGHGPLNHHI